MQQKSGKRLSQGKKSKSDNFDVSKVQIPTLFWRKAHNIKLTAKSFKNFAALLLVNLFDHNDLAGRNSHGYKKPAIEKNKLDIVRAVTQKLYPTDMSEKEGWRNCEKAIDEMLRRGYRKKCNYRTLVES